jgi:hypothetical protein
MAEANKPKAFDLEAAVERLQRPSDDVRLGVLAEILAAKAGAQAIESVAACLDDGSERVRRAAVVILGDIGEPAAGALVRALGPRQLPLIRSLAAVGLASMGAAAAPAIDALMQCLSVRESELPSHAALALGKIGAPAVPALRQALTDPDLGVRGAAADALGYAGPAAVDALDDLRGAASASPPPMLALAYTAAIVKISDDPKAGLPLLIEALKDKDDQFRARVIEKIGEMRTLASAAAPALMECLKDPAAKVRANAALGLARIGASSPEAIAALQRALADVEAEVRINAGIALGGFGPIAASAMPHLRVMQNDRDARAAAVASAALERIGESRENLNAKA